MGAPSLEDLSPEQIKKLAGFANSVLNGDPKLSKEVRRIVKKHDASYNAPDLELEDQIQKLGEEEAKKREEMREEWNKDRRNASWEREQAKMRSSGYEPEYIEKIMKDEQIASVDTAIKFADMQAQIAPATPPGFNPSPLPAATGEDKKLWENPKQWQTNTLHKAIDELRGKKAIGR
jgi:hypothetical protein